MSAGDVPDLRIVTIDTIEGCHDHVRLEGLVWGMGNGEVVPVHLLIAIARNGGLVLGAYAGEAMVGLLLGLPALYGGRLAHLSHMLGVHPDWRSRGVGERLKWRQREVVLAQGIDTVVWTYDPLEAVNARLNLAHLGGRVYTYTRDYYGAMSDSLNRGIPSDRFTVTWRLDAPHVRERAAGGVRPQPDPATPVALAAQPGPDGLPRPGPFTAPAGGPVLVACPARMQEIKRRALDVALAWRLQTRAAFEHLFARGYAATDVIRRDDCILYYLKQEPHED